MIAYAFLSIAAHKAAAGKKESTDHRLNQACPPCAAPSSTSSSDCHFSNARLPTMDRQKTAA